jgi:hypothetical protein
VSTPVRIVLVIAIAFAGMAGYRWWASPERQIRRVLDDVASRLSHDRPATGLGAVAEAAGLQEHLAPDVVVEAGQPFPPLTGRDAAMSAAVGVRTAVGALKVEFVDVTVTLGGDGTTAVVDCTASATIGDRAGQQRIDAREIVMTFRHTAGRWIIERAAAVNVLEPVT